MAMTSSRHIEPDSPAESAGEERWLAAVGVAIWDNLPLLLAIDVLLCLAALPALLCLAIGAAALAPIVAAITLGPLWLGAVETGRRLLAGDAVTLRHYLTRCHKDARRGLMLALVPGGVLALFLGTISIAGARPEARWLLAPLWLNGCLAAVTVLAGSWVFPLATRTQASSRALWQLALAAAGSAPLATLGTVALAVLLWLGWRIVGPLVPAVLAAPFALYLAALGGWWSRWATGKLGDR